MLIVFGPVTMELHVKTDHPPTVNKAVVAGDYTLNAGGRGANQALASARSGAKVALVGRAGEDDYAHRILDKIRRDGVTTSGVGRLEENHTGLDIICESPNDAVSVIKSPGANAQAIAEQIPDEILGPKAFVLIQTELAMKENIALLERAKATGATTILNLAPSIDLSKALLDKLDYLIVNHREAQKFIEKLGLPAQDNSEKIAHALAKLGNLTCIITMGENGSIAYTPDDKGWRVPTFAIETLVDRNGIEDAYCGTFAACLQSHMPLHIAMMRANAAATLACTKPGGQEAFPYLAEIDEKVKELPEPQALN